jgi:hypothetical protein
VPLGTAPLRSGNQALTMVSTRPFERNGMGIMRTRGDGDHDTIRATSLFRDCSKAELRAVSRLVTMVDVPAGRVLMFEGDAGRECFVIVSGQAVVERGGVMLGHAIDGAVVGELAVMDGGRRAATVTAATPMRLLVMSLVEFRTLCSYGMPSVMAHLDEAAAAHRSSVVGTAPDGSGDETATTDALVPALS